VVVVVVVVVHMQDVDDSPGDGVMLPRSSSREGRWVDGADMLALQPCVAWPTRGPTRGHAWPLHCVAHPCAAVVSEHNSVL
jgi:hypothetical protein